MVIYCNFSSLSQVQTYQREVRQPHETPVDHLGRVVGLVAPSMFLSSLSEATCFFLAALSDMPAVYSFAVNAGFAILIDFFMQVRKIAFQIHKTFNFFSCDKLIT